MPFSIVEASGEALGPGATGDVPPQAAGGGRARPGLVSSLNKSVAIRIDPVQARLSRMSGSTRMSVRLADQAIREGGFRGRWLMVTATYRPGVNWSPGHMAAFMACLRKWFHRRGRRFVCVWVAEMQQRGAVHYHVLVWLPKGLTLPKSDQRGWWPHGSTKTEVVRHAVAYIAKYASKGEGGPRFPKGCRIHGSAGLDRLAKRYRRWALAPGYVRKAFPMNDGMPPDLTRPKGGGWLDRETGEFVVSPWCVLFSGGCAYLIPRGSPGVW